MENLVAFFTPGQAIGEDRSGNWRSQSEACHGGLSRRSRTKPEELRSNPKPGGTDNLLKMEKIGMTKFYYVYLLVDVATESHRYTGVTEDLTARLAKHNAGEVPHTSKFKPWKIETAIAFSSKEKAYAFEAYLKTHSGRSFANRHF